MASNIPVIVQGNSFSLAIPLQIYVIDDDEMVLQDYTPDPTDQISIQLKGSRRNYTYTPTDVTDNVCTIALGGYELADNYGVVVSIVKADGQRLRSFRTDQFFIVESSDDLTQDDIIEGLEENVIYLNSSIFVAGADGRGIESIIKTGTSGLVDTYTITYSDATTSTFNVTNGAQGEPGATISSVDKTATAGKVDTYTITMTDGNTFAFQVTNGLDGVDLGLANIVNDLTTGGATNVLSAEQGKVLNNITPKVGDNANDADLDITDEDGNVLVRMGGGNIQTNNFDSAKCPSIGTSLSVEDLDITDEDGNVLVRFEDGHIQTKKFSSKSFFTTDNFVGSPLLYTSSTDDSGLSLFSTLQDIYDAYDSLVSAYPQWLSREADVGKDASNTYDVRHYCLRFQYPLISASRAGTIPNMWSDTTYKYKRLLVQAGIHADERYCILGCYLAVKEIIESNELWAQFIRNNFIIDIVPVGNPWGAANNWQSNNSNNVNLNRTYFENKQAENINLETLISSLKTKGLVGIIDCHNTDTGDGYFVAKPTYTHWGWYAVLTQQLSSTINEMAYDIFESNKNHFHLWDATGNNGQLHQYADSEGLLGCTFEVALNATTKGSVLSKAILINIINAFGTYKGV